MIDPMSLTLHLSTAIARYSTVVTSLFLFIVSSALVL